MRRRRVLYDATSRAAATAAELVRGEFDVVPLSASTDSTTEGPAVVLVGRDGPDMRRDVMPVGMVALVDGDARGPWPSHWFSVLPAGVSAPILLRGVESAFADLDRAAETTRLDRELSELNAIGIRLSAERNPRDLIETILTKAREITHSDAGSLYLVEEAPDGTRDLRFVLAQNDSVDLPFRAARLPLISESVAGHVALTGAILNLEDAYRPPGGAPFHINRSFDEETGYRTRSMLVVPMRTPEGETIGALQLINCKPDFSIRLRPGGAVEATVQRFTARHEQLAGSLASQAAVAIQNRLLYESIRELFEGFVKASVTPIESRDPTTSGHSALVANLTQSHAASGRVNEPAVLPRGFGAGIERLVVNLLEDHVGNRESVISPDEAKILAIPRGSLTPAEFKEIQSHVIHTYEFLTRIPWTREFRRIPEIARSHHEKLDGTGYPEGRRRDEILVQSRMMTIADIYDALTAGDRPYKKAIPKDEALDILEQERQAGHLDGALLDVFVEAKIYEQAQVPPVSPSATDRRRPMR